MNAPIQIELINASGWWLPWLPVLGSAVVAAVAFVGIWVSNATNRAAIASADLREIEDWRRTKCMEAISELLEKSQEITGDIRKLHADLITEIAGYASVGTLHAHTDDFFFKESNLTVQRLRQFRQEIAATETTMSIVAPGDVFVAATALANKTRELLHSESEAMRHWYLFRARDFPDDSDEQRKTKDTWWYYEGQIAVHLNEVRAAHDELASTFRRSVTKEGEVSFDGRINPFELKNPQTKTSEQSGTMSPPE